MAHVWDHITSWEWHVCKSVWYPRRTLWEANVGGFGFWGLFPTLIVCPVFVPICRCMALLIVPVLSSGIQVKNNLCSHEQQCCSQQTSKLQESMCTVDFNNAEICSAGRSVGDVWLALKFSLNNKHVTDTHAPQVDGQRTCHFEHMNFEKCRQWKLSYWPVMLDNGNTYKRVPWATYGYLNGWHYSWREPLRQQSLCEAPEKCELPEEITQWPLCIWKTNRSTKTSDFVWISQKYKLLELALKLVYYMYMQSWEGKLCSFT